jgi:sterol desaturase/sphingolipid hydroxylase (fatty acid hydroxylase superfamily)
MIESLFDWLIDPAKRTYFGYWVTTLIVAVCWAAWSWQKRSPYIKQLTDKNYWFNQSTFQDAVLVFLNRGLFFLIGVPWVLLTLDIALSTMGMWRLLGQPSETVISGPWVIGVYTLIIFVLDDVTRFGLHRLMHKYKFLWRIHQLHHSASTLTPLTTLRLHPIESVLYSIRSSLVHGICAGSSFFFLGFQADSWQIWGATAWVIAFNILGANLRHSQIPFNYGRFEKWLISPSQHQAHHGLNTMNKNYGSILSIWDRMGNSWRSGKEGYTLPTKAQPLGKQLLLQLIKFK